jgi:hypothetical protein
MKRPGEHFTGTIDQFLNHCAGMDIEAVQSQVDKQNRDNCIEYIKKESNCSDEEATELYDAICLSEVKQVVDKLVADGLLEISEYGDDGEPKFVLTELGNQVHGELNTDTKPKKTVRKKK